MGMAGSYLVCVVIEAQVAQHHDAAEEQGCGVGLVLTSDVGRCAVHSLHQRQPIGTYRSRHFGAQRRNPGNFSYVVGFNTPNKFCAQWPFC